jgi:uncharacterized protein (DUF1778 family)
MPTPRSELIALRLKPKERLAWEIAAEEADVTLSQFVRDIMNAATKEVVISRPKTH